MTVTITIDVDGVPFDTLTVNPSTLATVDSCGDPVSLFGKGANIDGAPNLREVLEEAFRSSPS